jgi:hypothetical protein
MELQMKSQSFKLPMLYACSVLVLFSSSASADETDKKYCYWNDKKFSEGATFCMFKNLYGSCDKTGKWVTETNANCVGNPSLSPENADKKPLPQ